MAVTANLILTRPDTASQAFLNMLPSHLRSKLNVCISPVFEYRTLVRKVDTDGFAGLIVSSSQGAQELVHLTDERSLPCHCIGRATTDRARQLGLRACFAGQTADELVTNLLKQSPSGPLLHVHGRHTVGNIAQRLSAGGCQTASLVIYDQVEQPLSKPALDMLGSHVPTIVPLFSARTARIFAQSAPAARLLFIAVLSNNVAEELNALSPCRLVVSQKPEARAMVDAVEMLVQMACRVEGGSDAQ